MHKKTLIKINNVQQENFEQKCDLISKRTNVNMTILISYIKIVPSYIF